MQGVLIFWLFVRVAQGNLAVHAEYIATSLGSYLTSQAGITIVFESAIVPRFAWRESKLTFKNVYVSRGMGPRDVTSDPPNTEHPDTAVTSPTVRRATVKDLAELHTEQRAITSNGGDNDEDAAVIVANAADPAVQYTNFHVSIDSIDITLSLPRWLDGKGLVREAVVKGVRGVIGKSCNSSDEPLPFALADADAAVTDRRHIVYDASSADQDHRRFRHIARPGDFHLESLEIEDLLVTVYQPDNFRPYTFSIFNASIPTLRKQWLFFDLLSAYSIVGQVDNCLYSLHKPQSMSRTSEDDLRDGVWKRMVSGSSEFSSVNFADLTSFMPFIPC